MRRLASFCFQPWVILFLILAVYFALVLPTVDRQGISWDEQNDLWIAQSYLSGWRSWITGSDIDPSQARLPMAVVALVYILLGRSDLVTGRVVSVVVGALTLVGVYQYCKKRFDTRRGLLAVGLLATSPFYLAFARVAFTETDIYLACLLIWLMIAEIRYQSHPDLCTISVLGVILGLGIAAKFTTLAVIPALWYAVLRVEKNRPIASRIYKVLFMSGVALLISLLVPPEHLTNPDILRSLWWRFQYEMPHPPSFAGEAAALHILSITLKSSPVVGFGMLLSLIWSVFRRDSCAYPFPILMVIVYFAGLLALPLAQTFYTIPLLPVLAVLTADQFFRLWDQRRRPALLLAVLAVISIGMDLFLCYPDFNLNGYQWLRQRRIAGRSSVGYRSVVQTPSDGVQQAFEWLNEHAQPGERVLAYLQEWHIVQATAPDPLYQIENGFEESLYSHPHYVVIHINAQIRQSWWTDVSKGKDPPYDVVWLEAYYTKVFSVPRRFGLEMASVWRRKE